MTRVAAVDCGTNTIKLLVADLDPGTGAEHELVREMRMVRLGQDVDRTGRLADEALARTFAAVDEYAAMVAAHDVEAIRFCATSAARDASNGAEFAAGVEARLGVRPEVVTGAEEAQLSYDGATRGLAGSDLPAPFLVVDIGGGSTELILGDGHGHVRAAQSLDIGSVRMTERYLPSDPPTRDEVAALITADAKSNAVMAADAGLAPDVIDLATPLRGVDDDLVAVEVNETTATSLLPASVESRDRLSTLVHESNGVVWTYSNFWPPKWRNAMLRQVSL